MEQQFKAKAKKIPSQSLIPQSTMHEGLKEPQSAVGRLRSMSSCVHSLCGPEPEHNFALCSPSDALIELESQVSLLRGQLSVLSDRLRTVMPDCLFNSCGEDTGESVSSYYAAGNLDTPQVNAIAELANSVVLARNTVSFIQANIVL